jgi:hypothetical protein
VVAFIALMGFDFVASANANTIWQLILAPFVYLCLKEDNLRIALPMASNALADG